MQTWRIPIHFLRMDGRRAISIHELAHPFVDLEFAAAREGNNWRRVPAMVDTGSSYTLLAPRLIHEAGCVIAGQSELMGNFGRQEVPMYSAAIRTAGAPFFVVTCEVAELDVRTDDGECLAVLGMDYLRFCRCVVEGPPGDSYLDLLERRIQLAQKTASPRQT